MMCGILHIHTTATYIHGSVVCTCAIITNNSCILWNKVDGFKIDKYFMYLVRDYTQVFPLLGDIG